jgi:hypothetical protein
LRRPRNEEEEEEEEEEEDLRCSDVFLPLDFRKEAFLCDEWNEGTRRKNKNVR